MQPVEPDGEPVRITAPPPVPLPAGERRSTGHDRLRVVALGGGHGLAAALTAWRRLAGDLTAVVTVADAAMLEKAEHLHEAAARACFIARSVNFPVRHEPVIEVAGS